MTIHVTMTNGCGSGRYGMTHLPNYKSLAYHTTGLCGAENVKTMSHHELKRGGITCNRCQDLYHFPPISGGTPTDPYGEQVEGGTR